MPDEGNNTMRRSVFYRPYLPLIRWPKRLMQCVAWLVIVCFGANCLSPGVVAAKDLVRKSALSAAPKKTEFDLAQDSLIALEETLDRMDRRLNGKFEFAWQETLAQKSHAAPPAAAARADLSPRETEINSNVGQLDAQQNAIQSFFTQTQSDLKSHAVAAAVQSRASAQGSQYSQLYAQLKQLLAAIPAAKSDADYRSAVAAAATFLRTHSSKAKRAKFDPTHLAFGTPKERPRAPLTTATALQAALTTPDKTLAAPSKAKPATSKSEPRTDRAKDLPPNLAPTEDAQITPAIVAKAAALNNNPLAIYQFVRNNVEYMPTYGSIQGSDYTLQTLRGNDIDQASLLIALLRAANIPAHYVYGTIQVPIDQVENWVGGVTDPNAALDLMGQGGIPTLGLAQGGVIKFAQLEHVWVEAQLGFTPGRGVKTNAGTTWVPMDASFKQYAFSDGMALSTHGSFDYQDLANHVQQTSTSNTSEGWVQNVDQTYVTQKLVAYQNQLTTYANNVNPQASLSDVLGQKLIVAEKLPYLAGALPYAVNSVASSLDVLPDSLRWAFHYSLGGNELLSKSLPSLAGHLLAVNFAPATSQDLQTLQSFYPATITDPSQMPTTLPAGIMQMKAQLIEDGQVAQPGVTYSYGETLDVSEGVYRPHLGWQDAAATLTVGEYQAIGLDLAGISTTQLSALRAQAKEMQDKINAKDYSTLTQHNTLGTMLQSAAANFFVQEFVKAGAAARMQGFVDYRLPSFGTVSTYSTVATLFDIPVQVSSKGVMVDVQRLANIAAAKSGNAVASAGFVRAEGTSASRSESDVLEQGFSENQQASGTSAVQALAVANQLGQRIYTIDSNNASVAVPALQIPTEIVDEIADSVNAGKVVTVSQQAVDYAGISELGYIVTDPSTGAAAYKIASGANGGLLEILAGHGGGSNDNPLVALMLQLLKLAGDNPILTAVLAAVLAIFFGEIGVILGLIIGIISLASDLLQALNSSNGPCSSLVNLLIGGIAVIVFVIAAFADAFTLGAGTVVIVAVAGLLLSFLFGIVPDVCRDFGG